MSATFPEKESHGLQPWEDVKPSILCRRCGDHGFITDGRWVVA